MRDIDKMGEAELRRYAQGLQEAMFPFATAADRLKYYGGTPDDTALCAYIDGSNTLIELIAFDDDIPHNPDECAGGPSRVTVEDLYVVRLALDRKY